MSREPSRQPTAPIEPTKPVDAPGGDIQRSPSLMPLPYTGLRRIDHPDGRGLPPPEVKVTTAWRISCDGGEGALGHPRVWYTIPHDAGFVDCGYCDARFIHQDFVGGAVAGDAAELASRSSSGRGLGEPGDHTYSGDRKSEAAGKQPGGDGEGER